MSGTCQMLESLENNEVILLMYLADELPPVDRQEVEQMLAADGGLRRALEALQAAHSALHVGLARLDQVESLSNQATLTRRIGRAMRQHSLDRASKSRTPERTKVALPWWTYPTAAAAAIFLAFTIWVISFNSSHRAVVTYPPNSPVAIGPAGGGSPSGPPSATDLRPTPAQLAQELENSFGGSTTEREDNQMAALQVDPQAAQGGDLNE
jgi:hypothetical protein